MTFSPPRSLELDLPDWDQTCLAHLEAHTEKLQKLAAGAGKGSDVFKGACLKLLELAIAGRFEKVNSAISRSVDVRALAFLMADAKEFEDFQIDVDLISRILEVQNPISRLGLLEFIKLYLKRFDLQSESALAAFSKLLRQQTQHYITADKTSDLAKIGQNAEMLFDLRGPYNVVKATKSKGLELDTFFCDIGLEGMEKGRYLELCQYQYYLETLNTIPVGEDDPVLTEVCRSEVYSAPGVELPLLGHEVLKILIDRAENGFISDAWQRTVLGIAGDPRVPQSDGKYQKWWALLGDERISKVKSWLSKFDLKLFLQVLERYGKDSGDSDLNRMFPARKQFLEGLLTQELVFHSRLFLTFDANHFVRRNYKKGEIPNYAIVRSGYTSMIYMQVGDIHMIEGTHNFKLWIFPDLPQRTRILNYEFNEFDRRELSSDLNWAYEREFGEESPAAGFTHAPKNCNWQKKAIDYLLEYGIGLNVEKLFSREDYALYKRLYGLPAMPSLRAGKTEPKARHDSIKPRIKICTKCSAQKPINEFVSSQIREGVYSAWCRECIDQY